MKKALSRLYARLLLKMIRPALEADLQDRHSRPCGPLYLGSIERDPARFAPYRAKQPLSECHQSCSAGRSERSCDRQFEKGTPQP